MGWAKKVRMAAATISALPFRTLARMLRMACTPQPSQPAQMNIGDCRL
jgi:hypothetical protein